MILFINEKNEIKDVNETSNPNLVPVEVDNDIFLGWSFAKICCFKVKVENGIVTMFTPYVDSRIIEHIERQGQQNITLQAQVDYLAMMTDVEMM